MATPYLRNYYAGGGTSTTLANAMGEYDGSFVITADTGWPGGAGFFTVVVDRGTSSEEKIRCASNSGTTVTVASDGNGGRGYDGTSATSHNAAATVSLCGTSVDFDQANQVVTQVLGQSDAAKGDILAMLSGAGPNTLTRVPIGSSTQVLGVSSGLPAWETPANGYGIAGFAANPMTPAVSLTNSVTLGANGSLSANTDTQLATLTLAAGTWLVFCQAVLLTTSSLGIGHADLWLSTTTASTTGEVGGTTGDLGDITGASEATNLFFVAVVTPGSSTPYYLNANSTLAATIATTGQVHVAVTNISGMTAVRIA